MLTPLRCAVLLLLPAAGLVTLGASHCPAQDRRSNEPSSIDLRSAPAGPVFLPAPAAPPAPSGWPPPSVPPAPSWPAPVPVPMPPDAPAAYPGQAGIRSVAQRMRDEERTASFTEAPVPSLPRGVPRAPTTDAPAMPGTAAPVPRANPVLELELESPLMIGPAEARAILEGMGMLGPRTRLSTALSALRYSHTYTLGRKRPPTDDVVLTEQERQWLFRDYLELRQALEAYPDQPLVDTAHPGYATWFRNAAAQLKHVPAAQRQALLEALLHHESSKIHWRQSRPVQSVVGATGFSQLLAATARRVEVNRLDPEQNLRGAARFLDDLVRRLGLTEALVYYNGGEHPPAASHEYARAIESRMNRTR